MSIMEERHDSMLLEILKDQKTVINFLDTIFGFLARRTDFYVEMKNPTDNIGFPPGFKEKLVYSAFKKFDPEFLKNQAQIPSVPPPENEIEVETCNNDSTTVSNEQILSNDAENIEMKTVAEDESSTRTKTATETFSFQPNEYYNGSKFDKYCWSQTISDLEIHIRLPEGIKSAKNLSVQILTDSIRVRDKISNNDILIGKMIGKCKNNDSVWSISNGKLQISLDKVKDIWWDRLFDNEPLLDLTKMDCSRYIDELSEDQQVAIEKLRYDQQQKALGLPTSKEAKNIEMLRKAWDVEGSPFKGQPFDPSILKMD